MWTSIIEAKRVTNHHFCSLKEATSVFIVTALSLKVHKNYENTKICDKYSTVYLHALHEMLLNDNDVSCDDEINCVMWHWWFCAINTGLILAET